MDLSGGPAALGGIMMGLALGAWLMGRWQGGLAVSDDRAPAAAPTAGPDRSEADEVPMQRATAVAPCQEAAQAERRNAMAAAGSLGELHDEISAYRRAQKVLAGLNGDGLGLSLADARSKCRYLGLMGEPTCGAAASARMACSPGTACRKQDMLPPGPARPERMRQPSAAAGDGMRV
jgi:hypothetical protein